MQPPKEKDGRNEPVDLRNEPMPSMLTREFWLEDRFSPAMTCALWSVIVLLAVVVAGTLAYFAYLFAF